MNHSFVHVHCMEFVDRSLHVCAGLIFDDAINASILLHVRPENEKGVWLKYLKIKSFS